MTEWNNSPKHLRIEDYTYELPPDRIAHFPMAERDASKLLVYQKGTLQESTYRNIAEHLPEHSLLIFNQTKVVQVRLLFQKESGAKIEIFCLEPDVRYADMHTAMTQKGEVYWRCLVGGANKWKADTTLNLFSEELNITVQASLEERLDGVFLIKLSWGDRNINFAEVLHAVGKVPLPPYMNREMKEEDKDRYQTIYAAEEGSVAAPTAGLHFTPHIFETFLTKQINSAYITLHVGAGTFKQVKSASIGEHEMHAEWIELDLDFLEQLCNNKGTVVAVGTTSMRTIESLYWIGAKLYQQIPVDWDGNAVNQWDPYEINTAISSTVAIMQIIDWLKNNGKSRLVTRTQIMIAPGYKPKIVQQLVTNFHQPDSTLLLLVAALIGDDWKKLYDYALAHDFRFLSYGDGCLLQW